MKFLETLNRRNRGGALACVPSVCSAHPEVLLACLALAQQCDTPLLVEATSNQVNQFGGYTGMKAADFIQFVQGICDANRIDRHRVLFGGDHLGPQAWRTQPADLAMAHARDLVASYVEAGFTKIHLDCSEGCAGESAQVGDQISAERAADLASICEASTTQPDTLSYVVGTEVPTPGGIRAQEEHATIVPTSEESAKRTLVRHQSAFDALGLHHAWDRVLGLVVQPGLEFSPETVHPFDLSSKDRLSGLLPEYENLAFEAHSTDYQQPKVFAELAHRHFTVLKVGPALTFAYRQAVYGLDQLATFLFPRSGRPALMSTMDSLMRKNDQHWNYHYRGDSESIHQLLHFSYADRIRYYWGQDQARSAVEQLFACLPARAPMSPVLEQFLPTSALDRMHQLARQGIPWHRALVLAQVQACLYPYFVYE
jgi:D-tagatose-1,6-bisphosphate aldolase subunit GatZ/KbaZ